MLTAVHEGGTGEE